MAIKQQSSNENSSENDCKTNKCDIMSFMHLIQQLKINKRTGWLNMGISYEKTESIADHMYRMSIMAQIIEDLTIDKSKCIKMALVHDMAEAITGDITPDDGISSEEKNRLETNAMNSIKEMLGSNPFGQEAVDLWKEYASDSTPEANFVKDLDKLELIIQAVEYEKREGISFEKWIQSTKNKVRHPQLKIMLQDILKERPKL